MESGQPPTSCAVFACTTSSTQGGLEPSSHFCGGFVSSVYFLSFQLLTTPPRFENSTRYKSLSTTIVRSFLSPSTTARGAAATVAGAALTALFWAPGAEGAAAAGGFVCCVCTDGFGAKNLAQSRITMMERADAMKMRSSGFKSFF